MYRAPNIIECDLTTSIKMKHCGISARSLIIELTLPHNLDIIDRFAARQWLVQSEVHGLK
jgi:hypothetical protein